MPRCAVICRCEQCGELAVIQYNPGKRARKVCRMCQTAGNRRQRTPRCCRDCGRSITRLGYNARLCRACGRERQRRAKLRYMWRVRGGPPPARRRMANTILQRVPDEAIQFCEARDRRAAELRATRD